jgi:hypothetical protein
MKLKRNLFWDKSKDIYKRLFLATLMALCISIAIIAYGYSLYQWAEKDPFEYNDYAQSRRWLPLAMEPRLEFSGTDEQKKYLLDFRAGDSFIYWNETRGCWSMMDAYCSEVAQLSNKTRLPYMLYFIGDITYSISGGCAIEEKGTSDYKFSLLLRPGCSVTVFTPPANNNRFSIRISFNGRE